MWIRLLLLSALSLVALSAEDEVAERKRLLGAWRVDGAAIPETWTLEDVGDALHVFRSAQGKVDFDLLCATKGQDCNGKDEGHKVKVSTYYNGPILVELETRDGNVTKRRFIHEGKTDRLVIDTQPLSGDGKSSRLELVRQ